MRISKAMTLLVLVYLAINSSGCTKQDAVSAEFLAPIKVELNKNIENLACVEALSYPFSFRERSNPFCWNCDKLVEAGLLTKEVVEDPFPDVRLELTELGKSAYVPGVDDSRIVKERPLFCFGRAHVKEITHVYGPVISGDLKMYGIRYIAELEDPNPFLLDPRAKYLEMPLPLLGRMAAGKTVLYPERNVTAVFPSNNPGDITLLDHIEIAPKVESE